MICRGTVAHGMWEQGRLGHDNGDAWGSFYCSDGLTIGEHQAITIERYVRLIQLTDAYVMPVLQGYSPESYASHACQYGSPLKHGQWVGVGSVCKRNRNPEQIEDILWPLKRSVPISAYTASGSKYRLWEAAL